MDKIFGVCLFNEYHGLYEDDYEGTFYYDINEKKLVAEQWSTAFYGGLVHQVEDFWYTNFEEAPKNIKEEIISALKKEVIEYVSKYDFVDLLGRIYYKAYSKKTVEIAGAELHEKVADIINSINNVYVLLALDPNCTTGSYKNNKWNIYDKLIKDNVQGTFIDSEGCKQWKYILFFESFLKTKIKKSIVRKYNYTGDVFEGEVIRVFNKNGYGYGQIITRVCVKPENGKPVWFSKAINDTFTKGELVKVIGQKKYENEIAIGLIRVHKI